MGRFELLLDEEIAGAETSNRKQQQDKQNQLPKWK
jgi:hypothetical protein